MLKLEEEVVLFVEGKNREKKKRNEERREESRLTSYKLNIIEGKRI